MKISICILSLWNLFTFLLMGLDKRKSMKGRWRISEKALLICTFAMGGLGCLCGAFVFHHKTSKWKFRILLPLGLLLNLGLLLWLWVDLP